MILINEADMVSLNACTTENGNVFSLEIVTGRHNPPGFLIHDPNPTHYFGGQNFDIKKHALTYGPNEWP